MTQTLSTYIADHYTVLAANHSGDIAGTGFDATVWREIATGQLYVSMRGTSGPTDFPTDFDLFVTGNARNQLVDMVNWWLQISTPTGQMAKQIKINSEGGYAAGASVAGQGLVTPQDLAKGIYVNGHSLGGYLTTAFTRLFSQQANVLHSYTFNGAGIAPTSLGSFGAIQSIIGPDLGLPNFPNASQQTNVFAENGVNVTTNSLWFNQAGTRVALYQEESGYPLANHSMYKITDMLALGTMLERLDPTFSVGRLNDLVQASSNVMDSSYEKLFDALRKALGGVGTQRLPIGDEADEYPARVTFHETLQAFQDNPLFAQLKGKLMFLVPPSDLMVRAMNDFAFFVALQDLSPLVVTSTDATVRSLLENIWRTGRPDDYSAWLADKGKGPLEEKTFSDAWIKDREALLQAIGVRNDADEKSGRISTNQAPADRQFQFEWWGADPLPGELLPRLDVLIAGRPGGANLPMQKISFGDDGANALTGLDDAIGDHLFGGRGNDAINGNGGADYIEGNEGNDQINAGDDDDKVLGGEGDDGIQGGNGADVLIGGKGSDQVGGGSGNDILYGSDGGDNLQGNEDNDFLNGGSGRDTLTGGTGNDYLYDQGGEDFSQLRGDEGNDVLEVKAGRCQTDLQGGAGNDILIGAAGINSLEGGEGNDIILGNTDYDIIKGGDGADNINASSGSDVITGGAGADYMRGEAGNDTYVYEEASFGTDLIEDGQGSDGLFMLGARIGSASYDEGKMAWVSNGYELRSFKIGSTNALAINMAGDQQNTIYVHNWQEGQFGISLSGKEENRQKPGNSISQVNTLSKNKYVDYILGDGSDGGQGNDILMGTAGESLLLGGVGNDVLDGRAGDDWLEGGQGNDFILTGVGKDLAYGGIGNDVMRAGFTMDWILDSSEDFYDYYKGSPFSTSGLKTDSNTREVFAYYAKSGTITEIAHPELAEFDIKFTAAFFTEGSRNSRMWWLNSGNAYVNLEPNMEVTLTLGDSEKIVRGSRVSDATQPTSNFGQPKDYKLYLGNYEDVLAASSGGKGVRFWGGDGQDVLYGGNESDKLHGEAENDLLVGYDGSDELYGEAGNDELSGGKGRDFLDGADGDDFLDGGLGADVIYGGIGGDTMTGDAPYLIGANWYPSGIAEGAMAGDLMYGGAGADKMWGDHGADYMYGGTEADTIYGGYDNDHLFGEAGADVLDGGKGDDYMDGGDGADWLADQDDGNDILFGRAGDDDLNGGKGDDILDGGDDNDILTGEDGNDILRGGAGNDHLYGDNGIADPGMDLLEGGLGDDDLNGGGNSDMYVFNLGDGNDLIRDDGGDGSQNTVVFKFGSDQIKKVERKGVNLFISYGISDSLTVIGYYNGAASSGYTLGGTEPVVDGVEAQNAIAQISFEDGIVWNRDKIYELAPPSQALTFDPLASAKLPYFVNALLTREEVRSAGKHQLTFTFSTSFKNEKNIDLFNETNKAAVRAALTKFSDVADLTFTEVASGEDADLRYFLDDLTSADFGAFAGYASAQTGEVHLNSKLYSMLYLDEFGAYKTKRSLAEGEFGFEVLLHETGHALGLKHPFESPFLPNSEDNNANTVMSYTQTVGPARQLAPFDVAALQYFYGVAKNSKTGNDAYTFADKYVYDAAGVDTFDASQETEGVYIDLAEGGWSSVGARNRSILAPKQTFIGYDTHIEKAIGGSGNDQLLGSSLANTLVGGSGNDTLAGNGGDDLLQGGAGIDTYRFGMEDGRDTIVDADGLSRIELRDDNSYQVYWNGGYLYHGTGGSRIAIEVNQIGELVIGDTSYVGQAIDNAVRITLGTSGDDSLTGSINADRINGIDGDDTLNGGLGDDVLDGGAGNDQLSGGTGTEAGGGNDTFLFSRGSGQDTIYESVDDIDQDKIQMVGLYDRELAFSLVDSDLIISIIGTEDRLLVSRYFESNAGTIETIELAGGLSLSKSDVFARVLTTYIGGSGNDYLWGNSPNNRLEGLDGDDIFEGGTGYNLFIGGRGNDTLNGHSGKDTYVFNAGDGQDVLRDVSDSTFGGIVDQVTFGPGLTPSDIVFSARADLAVDDPDYLSDSSNDLIVKVRNTTDKLIITEFFSYGRIETFTFSDGTKLSASDVFERIKRTIGSDAGENLRGGDGADGIAALAGNDRVLGFGGNDSIDGGDGNDNLNGGEGDDRLLGGNGRDSLYGDDGNDTLISMGDDYVLEGGAGNDVLDIGAGGDSAGSGSIRGGTGSDRYILRTGMGKVMLLDRDLAADAVDTIEFADLMLSDVRVEQDGYRLYIKSLKRTGDNIEIYGLWDSSNSNEGLTVPERVVDTVRFADGSQYAIEDIIRMSFRETPFADSQRGTRGDDTLSGGAGADWLWGQFGNDVLCGGDNDDVLYGMQGSDLLEGGAGNDTLYGADDWGGTGDGANTLIGGEGNDLNIGGNGDDVFVFGRGDGSDTIQGASTVGNDTLKFGAGVLPAHVQLYRDNADLVAVIDGSSTQTRIKLFFTSSNLPVEQMVFENGTVWTGAQIQSSAITGQVNQLTGTASDDVFVIDNTFDTVTEAADAGVDEVRSSVSYFLPTNVENFTATGVLNLAIQGNGANNVLRGNTSDNEFRSGGGVDRALGGRGDDTYYRESNGWLNVEELADEGNDTLRQVNGNWVYSDYGLYLPDNVENLILGASNSWWTNGLSEVNPRSGYGNGLDNLIKGDVGIENFLDGNGGSDTLIGGNKVDVFRVDSEDDVIIDYYAYDSGKSSSVRTFYTSEVLLARGDVVESSAVRYTLGDNLEHLVLTSAGAANGTGNALNNVIVGNQDVNRIEGGAGNDKLFDAAPKNDNWGSPAQPWDYASDNDTLLGEEGDDQLTAFYGSDLLDGGIGNDVLKSAGGSSTLIGGAGNDTLSAGEGNDIYVFSLGSGQDTITNYDTVVGKTDTVKFTDIKSTDITAIERRGDNLIWKWGAADQVTVSNHFNQSDYLYTIDQIQFSDGVVWSETDIKNKVSYYGDANANSLNGYTDSTNHLYGLEGADNLTGGTLADTLYGGTDNDTLIGGAGDDWLLGESGNDSMVGGDGDDLYTVDSSGDVVVETADYSAGIDSVYATADYVLPSNVEYLILEGTDNLQAWSNADGGYLIGNDGNNYLHGDAFWDVLNGGAGVDILAGGLDADIYILEDAQDVIIEAADGGYDTIWSYTSESLVMVDNVEEIVHKLTGPAFLGLNVTGNALDNKITGSTWTHDKMTGGAGNDSIYGLGGQDTIRGGLGNDYLLGGAGADSYYFSRGDGQDRIADGQTLAAGTQNTLVDKLLFEGNVLSSQLWFTKNGNDLFISVIGSQDSTTVKNWYQVTANYDYKIEQIKAAGDNKTLLSTKVDQLVQAMSGMTPPPLGQTTLTAEQQQALAPALATAWA